MVKVFLHISKDEQRARLQARIDDPEKNWKFRRADLDVRAAVGRVPRARTKRRSPRPPPSGRRGTWCPADHKWVRDVAVATLLVDVLDDARPADPAIRSPASRASSSSEFVPISGPTGLARRSIDQNGSSMDVESRDSVSLKPAELDELGQLVSGVGLPLQDEQLDRHVEQFPLVAIAEVDGEIHGFLFGSLERIGGTPCILWGLGGCETGPTAPGRASTGWSPSSTAGPRSRSPTRTSSSPGGWRIPAAYTLFSVLDDVCPRPKYTPNGEERAWGRRLARRFGCDARYDDRSFRLTAHGQPELVLARPRGQGRRQGRGRAGRRGRPRQR